MIFFAVLFFQCTTWGRVTKVYILGGLYAPWGVQSECRSVALTHARELSTLSSLSSEQTVVDSPEYWHYHAYRECLHRAGYAYDGSVLPKSVLYALDDETRWYVNTLAGVYLRVPTDTVIVHDNTLDILSDPFSLHSELHTSHVLINIDVYTHHETNVSSDVSSKHVAFVSVSTSTIISSVHATTTSGVPYISIHQDDGTCSMVALTDDKHALYMSASCDTLPYARAIFNTVKFIPPLDATRQ